MRAWYAGIGFREDESYGENGVISAGTSISTKTSIMRILLNDLDSIQVIMILWGQVQLDLTPFSSYRLNPA